MSNPATLDALARVDDRSKEGIKNLDRRITLMEDRLEDSARLQAQDARELRDKIDLQGRRFDTFTEQQGVLILTTNNNKKTKGEVNADADNTMGYNGYGIFNIHRNHNRETRTDADIAKRTHPCEQQCDCEIRREGNECGIHGETFECL